MRNNITKFMFCLFFSLLILSSFVFSVSAYYGNWTSGVARNWIGPSKVGTTYTGGAGDAVVVTLTIKMESGSNVGSKTVGVTIDQTVSHIAWGQPNTNRYGVVLISGYHLPWFDVNF